jgi:uncharacterized protein YjbI with pentapeptide repeats
MGVCLTDVRLTGGRLTGVRLTGGRLTGGRLTDGHPTSVRLTGGRLTGVHLTGMYPTGGHLTGMHLMGGHPTGGVNHLVKASPFSRSYPSMICLPHQVPVRPKACPIQNWFVPLLALRVVSGLFYKRIFQCAHLATCDFAFDRALGSLGLTNSKTGMTESCAQKHVMCISCLWKAGFLFGKRSQAERRTLE